jgi:hypothetical protein
MTAGFLTIAPLLLSLNAIAQAPEHPPATPEISGDGDPGLQVNQTSTVDQRSSDSVRLRANGKNIDTQNSICLLIEAAAQSNGIPVDFFTRVIWQESRFRSDAVGPTTRSGLKAQGIAQFMPATALEHNLLDPFDPVQALPKAAAFLRDMRVQFGNRGLAAAAYNAGPRRIRDWINGIGPMPAETRNYVQSITGLSVDEWVKHGTDLDDKWKDGAACTQLKALPKRPNPFVAALEKRVITGSAQPWTVILTAGFSRTKILADYSKVQQFHMGLQIYDAFVTQIRLRSRGPIPFYQVRIGVPDRTIAYRVCDRIRSEHGACVIMRPPGA